MDWWIGGLEGRCPQRPNWSGGLVEWWNGGYGGTLSPAS